MGKKNEILSSADKKNLRLKKINIMLFVLLCISAFINYAIIVGLIKL